MKGITKSLIALTVLLVLGVGIVMGLRLYFSRGLINKTDVDMTITAYAKVCKTSPEKVRPLWESIASSAIDRPGQSLDEALWEYSLEDTQRSRTSVLGKVREGAYAIVGYDPYRQIEQKAFKTANQVFLDDMQVCFHYQVFESEQARKELKEPKDLPSVAHERFIQSAAETAEIESAERWQAIQKNPGNFLNPCIAEEIKLAVEFGKMKSIEAEAHARSVCQVQLEELHACMKSPSATAQSCFTDVLESGD